MAQIRILYGNRWVRYTLTVLLIVLVVARVHPERLSRAATAVHPGLLALALALTVPFLYLKALRWYLMLRAAGIEASFSNAAVSLIGGMGLALITPARLGELIRVAYLRDQRKWKAGGLVMIDKGFDVLVLAGLSVAGAWALIGPWAGLLLAIGTGAGLLAVYNAGPLSSWLVRASGRLPFRAKLDQVWSSLESLSPRSTTTFLSLTLLAFLIVLIQFAIVLLSWRSWSLDIVFLTFPLVVLTNVLPITVGGLGVREGAAALLLGHYGVSPADAALAAFLMFAVNTALPGLAGAFLLPAPTASPMSAAQSLDGP